MNAVALSSDKNYNGFWKAIVRQIVIQHAVNSKKKIRSAMLLPGPQQLCVRLALAVGLIDRNTIIYAAEREPDTYQEVEKFLRRNFNKFHLWQQASQMIKDVSLCENQIKYQQRSHCYDSIDWLYLDYCGEITDEKYEELEEMLRWGCKHGIPASFTFSVGGRNNDLINSWMSGNLLPAYLSPDIPITLLNGAKWDKKDKITVCLIKRILDQVQNWVTEFSDTRINDARFKSSIDSVYKYIEDGKRTPMISINLTLANWADEDDGEFHVQPRNDLLAAKPKFNQQVIIDPLAKPKKQKNKAVVPHATKQDDELSQEAKQPKGEEMKTAREIASLFVEAARTKNPAKKAAASRALNQYAPLRARERGCTENQVRAGVMASVTRELNGN